MARITPTQAAQRWATGVQTKQANYTQGVQNPRADWATETTNAIPAMISGLQQAHADGRIATGISNAGTRKWQNNTIAKANNWSAAASNRDVVSRVTSGMTKLFGYLDAADSVIATMPHNTFQERMARSSAYLTEVHNQAIASGGR